MPRGPGFWFTFVYYTVMATTVAALSSAPLLFGGRLGLEAIETALPIGLVLGLLGGYFNRTASLELTSRNATELRGQLDRLLTDWEFGAIDPADFNNDFNNDQLNESSKPIDPSAAVQVYERTSWRKWFSGRVFVRVDRQTATIVSRASLIRKLQRQLTTEAPPAR